MDTTCIQRPISPGDSSAGSRVCRRAAIFADIAWASRAWRVFISLMAFSDSWSSVRKR